MKKKAGYVMIVLGILIPVVILPITTGFNSSNGFIRNFLNAKIIIKKPVVERSDNIDRTESRKAISKWLSDSGIAIPYRFPLAFSIAFIFLGILAIDQSKSKGK